MGRYGNARRIMIFIQHILDPSAYKKIIFMDRDGVINEDSPDYVRSRSQVKIKESAEKALELLHENEIGVIVVTNQKMIGKELVTMGEAIDIHMDILKKVHYEKYSIIASCICPHLDSDNCNCRKPACGMADLAEKVLGIDASDTYMIGDRVTDVGFAANKGMESLFLGDQEVEYPKCRKFENVYKAALWLVTNIDD